VSGAYQILSTKEATLNDETIDLVWHKQVLLKVSILAWRLLRDRLPTKQNLLRRGIIQPADINCVAGCGNIESLVHMFIHCDIFGALWQHVRNWLGISGADPFHIHARFIQFTNALGTSRSRRSFMQLLWLLCVWTLWDERNNRLFNNVHTTLTDLIDKVKYTSLWWLKATNASFVYGSQSWWSDPLRCLGID
jgi:hypothetical protein